jgi:hypothetical protein
VATDCRSNARGLEVTSIIKALIKGLNLDKVIQLLGINSRERHAALVVGMANIKETKLLGQHAAGI